MATLKDIARYCAEHIEDWPSKLDLALGALGRHEKIDFDFFQEVEDCVYEWCEDNGYSADCWDNDSAIEVIDIILNS